MTLYVLACISGTALSEHAYDEIVTHYMHNLGLGYSSRAFRLSYSRPTRRYGMHQGLRSPPGLEPGTKD